MGSNPSRPRNALLAAVLLLAAPALAGCLGAVDDAVDDGRLSLGTADDEAADLGTLRVYVQVTKPGGYESAETTPADIVATPAAGDPVDLEAAQDHVDLASEDPAAVAIDDVPPGDYDEVAFTLTDIHGIHDGTSFEDPNLDRRVTVSAGVPVDVQSTTTVIVGADLASAGDPQDGFDPAFNLLGARQDGEPLEVADAQPQNDAPVARAEVFNGTGVKIYESDFEAAGGETDPVAKGEETTWTARPSEDPDGAVEAYKWTFPDGTTQEGKTVTHAFETGGIHAVTLEVADDGGVTDTLTLDIPVRYLVDEDGEDLYSNSTSGSFQVGGTVGPAAEESQASHTFDVPEILREGETAGDGGSGEDDGTGEDISGPEDDDPGVRYPIHGGAGHGDHENPEDVRRLAQATFSLAWSGESDAYSFEVYRDDELLGSASGDTSPLEVTLTQLDGWYLDGGNYTVEITYEQGVEGQYDLDVTGTYIPIPAK